MSPCRGGKRGIGVLRRGVVVSLSMSVGMGVPKISSSVGSCCISTVTGSVGGEEVDPLLDTN